MLNKEQREFLLRCSEEELKRVDEALEWMLPELARSEKCLQEYLQKKRILEGTISALKEE